MQNDVIVTNLFHATFSRLFAEEVQVVKELKGLPDNIEKAILFCKRNDIQGTDVYNALQVATSVGIESILEPEEGSIDDLTDILDADAKAAADEDMDEDMDDDQE